MFETFPSFSALKSDGGIGAFINIIVICIFPQRYAWNKIKKLFVKKMDMVIDEFEKQIPMADLPQLPNVENVNFENRKRRLHNTVDRFDG